MFQLVIFFVCLMSVFERSDPEFTEAILRVRADSIETILRGLNRTIPEVLDDLTVVDGLQVEYLGLFEDFLFTKSERVAILRPPPRSHVVGRVRILGTKHERGDELNQVRLCTLKL